MNETGDRKSKIEDDDLYEVGFEENECVVCHQIWRCDPHDLDVLHHAGIRFPNGYVCLHCRSKESPQPVE